MFFESGLCDLPLSAAWHPVRDSFRVGRARDAFEVGGALAADAHGDRLLWAEVLLALGRPRHAQKALAGADHWAHALIRGLGLCREGRLLAADRLLDGVISGLWKNEDGYHEHALKYMLARWAWKRDERQLMTDAVYDPLERAFVYVNAFLQGYAWNTDWIPAPGSGPEPLNTFLDSSKRD